MADALSAAQDLYTDALEALREQRQQIEEDQAFSDPSDPQQWDETIRRQRESDPGGARPCLVMDHTGQYVDNVAGTVAQSPPALHTVPVDGKADGKVAEQIDGIFRHVEYSSRAQSHYITALRSAARVGVGYLIVRPEYVDRAMGYQEPRIAAEADALRVVLDPWCTEVDGKDAGFAYLLTSLSQREFKRKYGKKAEQQSFGDNTEASKGVKGADGESILIAEQWWVETKAKNIVVHTDSEGQEASLPEDEYHEASQKAGFALPVSHTYSDKTRVVHWRQMSGAEVFDESEYPANQIGIVPVYGYTGIKDGRMTYCGIPRRARNPQRAYNYHVSEQMAFIGNAPKAPWLVSMRAIRGVKDLWDRASLDSRAYLPFNDLDDLGAIAAPQRPNIAVNLQNHMAGAEQALHDLEASIGMYQANLGAPSNETSRVAIDGRKESGQTSTSHFPLNLSASLGQVGRICMQMLPRLTDQKRVQRILGVDSSPGFVTIDPGQKQPLQETDDGLSINPGIGSYDVRIVIGTAYTTQRSQAQAALGEVMRTNPGLTPAIAPLWAANLDIPNAEKLAQILTAMAPPAVQAILNPSANKQPGTADLMHQVEQLKQGLQAAVAEAHSAQQEVFEAHDKLRDKATMEQVALYDAETARLKVTGANEDQLRAVVGQLITQMLHDSAPMPGDAAPLPPIDAAMNAAPQPLQPMPGMAMNGAAPMSMPPGPPAVDPTQPPPPEPL